MKFIRNTRPSPITRSLWGALMVASSAMFMGRLTPVWAGSATTRPAGHSPMATWLDQLGDSDAAVRREARYQLMGLTRDDLPALRRVVAAAAPLSADQVSALRDVVSHVYLSGEPLSDDWSNGFVGLYWPLDGLKEAVYCHDLGTPVMVRIPGMPAYRELQVDDVILGIEGRPDVDCRYQDKFRDAIGEYQAAQRLTLRILRGGRQIEVNITLSRRPAALYGVQADDLSGWIADWQLKAGVYWNREFAPLVQETLAQGS